MKAPRTMPKAHPSASHIALPSNALARASSASSGSSSSDIMRASACQVGHDVAGAPDAATLKKVVPRRVGSGRSTSSSAWSRRTTLETSTEAAVLASGQWGSRTAARRLACRAARPGASAPEHEGASSERLVLGAAAGPPASRRSPVRHLELVAVLGRHFSRLRKSRSEAHVALLTRCRLAGRPAASRLAVDQSPFLSIVARRPTCALSQRPERVSSRWPGKMGCVLSSIRLPLVLGQHI